MLLRDVLIACNVKKPADGAGHVCFVGTDKENMPKGRYGTSITWHTAMDPACDVLLAYMQVPPLSRSPHIFRISPVHHPTSPHITPHLPTSPRISPPSQNGEVLTPDHGY